VTLFSRAATQALMLLFLLVPCAESAAPLKVLLDTDIGGDIDDAWALAFLISHPDFEPLGVTITDGDTTARARVALKLLDRSGRGDVPVAVGRRTKPLEPQVDYQLEWAADYDARQPITQPAADFIVDTARKHPGEVVLIAVGPLQNVADALRREPKLGTLVKRVVLMSGCVYGSVFGLVPEWNVKVSIADAQLVYGAGLPLTIVPLDATTLVVLKQEERERLRARGSPLTTSLEALYRLWLDAPDTRMTLHDQLAVAETASPGAFFGRSETLPLVVDAQGFTKIDQHKGKPVAVQLEPRRAAFMEFYLSRLLSGPVAAPASAGKR
jgi:inosine-uridine nucleoside N-ribohydrolase